MTIIKSQGYIDNDTLSDMRYEINGISTIDIHPRINSEIKKIKELEKKKKIKKEKRIRKKKR